jgi:uncharacterized protein with von Willebrand factor type A (vWA) domain
MSTKPFRVAPHFVSATNPQPEKRNFEGDGRAVSAVLKTTEPAVQIVL